MPLDLYNRESLDRLSSMPGVQVPDTGIWDGFARGSALYTMRGFATTARAIDLAGAVGPVVQDAFTGGTEAQDRYFKEHDETFGSAVDFWTPRPGEVGAAAQVVGTLASTLPTVMTAPELAVLSAHLGAGEELVKRGVSAEKAQIMGGLEGASMGLGIWMPILGTNLWQRALLGGAGYNIAQGLAVRGAGQVLLKDTPAEQDYQALDLRAITLDALLGMAFGTLAHISPAQRAQGEAAWAKIRDWTQRWTPSQVDALATMRQAEHLNVDSMPGKPTGPEDVIAHVERMKKAIEQLARNEPIELSDMPEPRVEPDPARADADYQRYVELQAEAERIREQEKIPPVDAFERAGRAIGERRTAAGAELRRRVAEMSPEQMREALLTDQLTGLQNRRAYEEAPRAAAEASIDLDGLKWVNDNLGHEAGDKLIQAMGQVLRDEAKGQGFHLSGDEFALRGASQEEVAAAVAAVRDRLSRAELTFRLPDGRTVTKKGVDFSHGIGATAQEADAALRAHKESRALTGERAGRGEVPPGVTFRPAEGGATGQGQAPAEVGAAPARPAIHERIAAELEATGRYTPEEAAANARLHQAFFEATAKRVGSTPEQIFEQFPLRVTTEEAPPGALGQRPSETLAYRRWIEGQEYEGRLFGGAYDQSRLGRMTAKDAPMREAIAQARDRYNEIRKGMGLEPVTDWKKRPAELVQRQPAPTRFEGQGSLFQGGIIGEKGTYAEEPPRQQAEAPPPKDRSAAAIGDLFESQELPGAPAPGQFNTLVAPVKKGEVHVATKKITTPEEAAQAFVDLQKERREKFQVLVLDKNNKPIAALHLFAGTVTQTSVYPREVLTAVYQTPGAAKIWMAHNHPSGVPEPSRADEMLTATLAKGLGKDIGVEFAGHVIIAGKRAVMFDHNFGDRKVFDVAKVERPVAVPIMEREIVHQGPTGDALNSPGAVRDYLRRENHEEPGLVLLDAQHRVMGWLPMSLEEARKLRTGDPNTGAGRLFRMIGVANPAAAILYSPIRADEGAVMRFNTAASNLAGALNLLDVRLLDAFTRQTHGSQLVSSAERGTLGSGSENAFSQTGARGEPRGYFARGERENVIGLLEHADKSTFLHESGHYYLDVLNELAGEGHPDLRTDQATLMKWFGIEGGAEAWAKMDLEERRPYHEQFARGFEQYLAEGKAPTPGLQGVFERFKEWLTAIYQSMTQLNVNVSDEVRGVMDRLLGGEAEQGPERARIAPEAPGAGEAQPSGGEPVAPGRQETATQQGAPAATGEITPERAYALQALGREAGWAEIGGRMIRGSTDFSSPDYAKVVGRTQWIPKAEWWPEFVRNPKTKLNEEQLREAINKAVAGEKLRPQEQRAINYLMPLADERVGEYSDATIEGIRERAAIQAEPRDPVQSAADRVAEEHPDLQVTVGQNADGSPIQKTPRQVLDDARAAVDQAKEDSKLFEIAANCILGGGG